ncbi:hypothetical protein DW322_20420 [Rhodococcus rhodnii]|uniref:Uncharacterized protein n=2 Tax=Rhodococcus rhodnii TaxID=38312 RepID=R7WJ34_9NOCA|nr:hypothetical protein [Rhodococcus rhodnii]EOM75261.1 hypothetical protein Rrhod_3396 [Rhodococcus rhodnii LMG 5362]TXG92100.1 hypothetical protein DW322_20420 [Rhodococcus rhodnii]
MNGRLLLTEIRHLPRTGLGIWLGALSVAGPVCFAALAAERHRPLPGANATAQPLQLAATLAGCGIGICAALLLGTPIVTDAYRRGTAALAFLAAKRRAFVVLAQIAAVALYSAVLGAFAGWLCVAATAVVGPGTEIADPAELQLISDVSLVYAAAGGSAAAVGHLVRRPVAAVGCVVAYLAFGELVSSRLPYAGGHLAPRMPLHSAWGFVIEGRRPPVPTPYWAAPLSLLLVTLAFTSAAVVVTELRDIEP